MIDSLHARALQIPFKVAFSHASASRDTTHSLWVEVTLHDGSVGYGEGCPRDYVTGETLQGGVVRRLVPRMGERKLVVAGTAMMAIGFFARISTTNLRI